MHVSAGDLRDADPGSSRRPTCVSTTESKGLVWSHGDFHSCCAHIHTAPTSEPVGCKSLRRALCACGGSSAAGGLARMGLDSGSWEGKPELRVRAAAGLVQEMDLWTALPLKRCSWRGGQQIHTDTSIHQSRYNPGEQRPVVRCTHTARHRGCVVAAGVFPVGCCASSPCTRQREGSTCRARVG